MTAAQRFLIASALNGLNTLAAAIVLFSFLGDPA